MDKIKNAFLGLKQGKKANIAYVVAGYPSLEYTKNLVNNLDKSVVDMLQIALPYSDPLADGEIATNASFEAIKNGVNTDSVFDALKECKSRKCLVLFAYYNAIYAYGLEKFVKRAKECDISGLIIPDLPCDENDEIDEICRNLGLCLVTMIGITSEYRLPLILKKASGFIYAIGIIGVTSGKQTPPNRLKNMLSDIKKVTNLPVIVGFGIKTNDEIFAAKTYADGVVVGSSIIEKCKTLSVLELIKFMQELFKD